MANRNDHIITLLARGLKRAQILVDPLVLSWRMQNSSIDKYMQKAKGDIVSNSQQGRTEHLGRAIMNLDYLYMITIKTLIDEEGNFLPDMTPTARLCLDIVKEKNKLLQLSKVYDPAATVGSEEIMPDAVHKLLDDVRIVNAPKERDESEVLAAVSNLIA